MPVAYAGGVCRWRMPVAMADGGATLTTANPDKSLAKERRVHAAAWQKGSLCRLKPAFRGQVSSCAGGRLEPLNFTMSPILPAPPEIFRRNQPRNFQRYFFRRKNNQPDGGMMVRLSTVPLVCSPPPKLTQLVVARLLLV